MCTATTYSELFDNLHRAYGLRLNIVNTGGGCHVAQGRLESGHWVVVTEADDFLSVHVQDRFDYEQECETTCGWFVGIYDNDATDGADRPAGDDGCLTSTSVPDAQFCDLTNIVGSALQALTALKNRQVS